MKMALDKMWYCGTIRFIKSAREKPYVSITDTDEQAKQQSRWIFEAITTIDATEREKQALSDLFHVEGFGGAENEVMNFKDAQRLATDKLHWLRDQIEEGFRSL
jgi:hypothetical protein